MNKTIFPIVTNMGKFDCEDIHENELNVLHKYKASEDVEQIRCKNRARGCRQQAACLVRYCQYRHIGMPVLIRVPVLNSKANALKGSSKALSVD